MTASRNVTVTNRQGVHARPADLLVKLANQYQSKIEIVKGHERVDAKSILAIMTLAAVQGTQLVLEADGPDAEPALDALAALFATNFAEDDNENQNWDQPSARV
jgi:phosphocarrier protein HPr